MHSAKWICSAEHQQLSLQSLIQWKYFNSTQIYEHDLNSDCRRALWDPTSKAGIIKLMKQLTARVKTEPQNCFLSPSSPQFICCMVNFLCVHAPEMALGLEA